METGICFRIIVRAQGRSESRCFHVWIRNMYLAILDEVSCRFLSDMRRKICVLLYTLIFKVIPKRYIAKTEMHVFVLSCVWFCEPKYYSPPASSAHGVFQARILEWVVISFSKVFSDLGSNLYFLHLLHWHADSYHWVSWEAQNWDTF